MLAVWEPCLAPPPVRVLPSKALWQQAWKEDTMEGGGVREGEPSNPSGLVQGWQME